MKGLDQVIKMRRQGYKPAYIVLQDSPKPTDFGWLQWTAADIPELLDLRALVGVVVSVHGKDSGEVFRWAQAAMNAGASTVLTMVYGFRGEFMTEQHRTLRVAGVDQ